MSNSLAWRNTHNTFISGMKPRLWELYSNLVAKISLWILLLCMYRWSLSFCVSQCSFFFRFMCRWGGQVWLRRASCQFNFAINFSRTSLVWTESALSTAAAEQERVFLCMYVHMWECVKYRYGMLQFTQILPCQYLLSILRFEERELVSIFMDVVEHEILAVFQNPLSVCTRTHAHTLTHAACIQSSTVVYWY